MFDQTHFDRLLKLNVEHALASPSRKREIEAEIVALVPPSLYSTNPDMQEMATLQANLQEQLQHLTQIAATSDLESFVQQLSILDEQIHSHAQRLGISFPRNDYEALMKKVVELRSNENK